jgi:hypothetical protein
LRSPGEGGSGEDLDTAISHHETALRTNERLLGVMARAEFRVREGAFAFAEYPSASFPASRLPEALAFVRDEDVIGVVR